MAKLAMKSGACPLFIAGFFLIMKKEKIRKEVNYAEAILTNVIHFAPIGILALLLIMVLILVANLRQTKNQ